MCLWNETLNVKISENKREGEREKKEEEKEKRVERQSGKTSMNQ